MKVNILGSEWKIKFRKSGKDPMLDSRDGYCDRTKKILIIAKDRGDSGFADYAAYQRSVIRHEIIHAFLIESGLDGNWQHSEQFGHDETMVDWIAIQFPKLYKAFEVAGVLEV